MIENFMAITKVPRFLELSAKVKAVWPLLNINVTTKEISDLQMGNQLLSRQIEAIKLHLLDDYLIKIVFSLFRYVCILIC